MPGAGAGAGDGRRKEDSDVLKEDWMRPSEGKMQGSWLLPQNPEQYRRGRFITF